MLRDLVHLFVHPLAGAKALREAETRRRRERERRAEGKARKRARPARPQRATEHTREASFNADRANDVAA